MKSLNKLCVILILLCLIIGEASYASSDMHFKDDYEAYYDTVGGLWQGKAPIAETDKGKSAEMTISASTTYKECYIYNHLGEQSIVNGADIKFSIKFSDNRSARLLYLTNTKNTKPILRFNENSSSVKLADESTTVTYELNKWYDVEIDVNFRTGDIALTMSDGTNTQTASTTKSWFSDEYGSGLSYLQFYATQEMTDNKSQSSTCCIDNVDVRFKTGFSGTADGGKYTFDYLRFTPELYRQGVNKLCYSIDCTELNNEKNITLYLVLYKNNIIQDIKTATIAGGHKADGEISVIAPGEDYKDYSIRAFVWDDALYPISDVRKPSETDFSRSVATDRIALDYIADTIVFYDKTGALIANGSLYDQRLDTKSVDGELYIDFAEICEACEATDMVPAAGTIENGGKTYITLSAFADLIGKTCETDENGISFIGSSGNIFTLRNDLSIYKALGAMLSFEHCDKTVLAERIGEIAEEADHPYLLADSSAFADIKALIEGSDTSAKKIYADVITSAEEYYNRSLLSYNMSGNSIIDTAQYARRIIPTLAFAYRLTGTEKYLTRCIEQMDAVASFTDWNPYHFLDTAELMYAMSIGYDWLYDKLDTVRRNTYRTAIIEKGLNQALEDYIGKYTYKNSDGGIRSKYWYNDDGFGIRPDNWKFECNGAVIVAATAVADSELSPKVINYAVNSLKKAVLEFAPDGGWHESQMYLGYMLMYLSKAQSCLNYLVGTDYGICSVPGFSDVGYFINSSIGQGKLYNYHNAVVDLTESASGQLMWLAKVTGNTDFSDIRLSHVTEGVFGSSVNGSIYDLIYYRGKSDSTSSISKEGYYRESEIAFLTTGDTANDISVSLHACEIKKFTAQMDTGSFIIDAYGTRFADDLGKEAYDFDDWYSLYRNRAEGHNTLVINPSSDGGQVLGSRCIIDEFVSGDSQSYARVDMTNAYTDASFAERKLTLDKINKTITISDSLRLKSSGMVYWFMHTQRPLQITDGGKTAILTGETHNMVITIPAEINAVFTEMRAEPFAASPSASGQSDNSEYKKLSICMENITDMNLCISFEFIKRN